MDTLDAGSDAPGRSYDPPLADAAHAVTVLYEAHAVSMIRAENNWTFTPLPAPAIFAAGGSVPSIAW